MKEKEIDKIESNIQYHLKLNRCVKYIWNRVDIIEEYNSLETDSLITPVFTC